MGWLLRCYVQLFSVAQEFQQHVKNDPMPVDRTIYVIEKVRITRISNTLDSNNDHFITVLDKCVICNLLKYVCVISSLVY